MSDIELYQIAETALCWGIGAIVMFAFCCAIGELIHIGTGDHDD